LVGDDSFVVFALGTATPHCY